MAEEHEMSFQKSYNIKAAIQLGFSPNIIFLSITVPAPLLMFHGLDFIPGGNEQDAKRIFLMEMFTFKVRKG